MKILQTLKRYVPKAIFVIYLNLVWLTALSSTNLNKASTQVFEGKGPDVRFFELKEGKADFSISVENNFWDSTDISGLISIQILTYSNIRLTDNNGLLVDENKSSLSKDCTIKISNSGKYRLNIGVEKDAKWRINLTNRPKKIDSQWLKSIGGIIIIFLGLALYFVPTIIGKRKKHLLSILILNLFLGWTLIGWIGALIWAINSPQKKNIYKYTCTNCGFEKVMEQKVKLFVCPNCNTENTIM